MVTERTTKSDSKGAEEPKTERSARKGQRGFTKGISGNPSGRPRGSQNKVPSFCQELIDDRAEEVISKALELALDDNDFRALKFLLDRLVPPKRSPLISIDLPDTRTAQDVLAAFSAIEESLRCGEITIDELQVVTDFLETKRRVIEDADLADRVANLEKRLESSS